MAIHDVVNSVLAASNASISSDDIRLQLPLIKGRVSTISECSSLLFCDY
jgi:hypothetical protein